MKSFGVILSALMLVGCGPLPVPTPVVSDYNGASVKLVQTNYAGEGVRTDASDAEAKRICAKGNKKAEFASLRTLPQYSVELLYLCL